MALNPNIILSGQPANVLGAMQAGTELASMTNQVRGQNALRQFMGEQGGAVMQGDPMALQQYAALAGPRAALDVQQGQQALARGQQVMRYADTAEGRAVAEHAATLTAEQRTAEAERISAGLSRAAVAAAQGDLNGLNATFQEYGLPPVASIEQAIPMLAQADEAYQILTRTREMTAGPEEPDSIRALRIRAAEAGLTPGTPEYEDFMNRGGTRPPQTNVNVSTGGGKFEEAFAKGDAETISTIFTAGVEAQRNIPRVERLAALLEGSPQGLEAGLKQIAGNMGIPTEGLDQIQAATAIINSLVPEQRQPGSGPMSDADLALFKQSLPRIINQPGGNELIIQTMRGVMEYDAEGARIVQLLRAGEINRSEAFQALLSRPDPLAGLNLAPATPQGSTAPQPPAATAPTGSVPPPPEFADPQTWPQVYNNMTPEERALLDGGQ